jgi:hypothetical protein
MALEQSDIPYEIRSFRGTGDEAARRRPRSRHEFQAIHKDFAEPTASDDQLATMLYAAGGTPMRKATELTRASLSVREEGIKLAFIMTDGYPNGTNEGVRQAFDAMEAQGITPILIFAQAAELDERGTAQLDDIAGSGRWEHVQSPSMLHRVVSDRVRNIYRNAERGRR